MTDFVIVLVFSETSSDSTRSSTSYENSVTYQRRECVWFLDLERFGVKVTLNVIEADDNRGLVIYYVASARHTFSIV